MQESQFYNRLRQFPLAQGGLVLADGVLLMACSFVIARGLDPMVSRALSFDYLLWSEHWVYHNKPRELIFYVLGVGSFSLYATISLAISKYGWLCKAVCCTIAKFYEKSTAACFRNISVACSIAVLLSVSCVLATAYYRPVILSEYYEIPSFKKVSEIELLNVPDTLRPAITQDGYVDTLKLTNECLHVPVAQSVEDALGMRYENVFTYKILERMTEFGKMYRQSPWLGDFVFTERQNELQAIFRTYSNSYNQYFSPVNSAAVAGGSLLSNGNLYGSILPVLAGWYLGSSAATYADFLHFSLLLYVVYFSSAVLFFWLHYRCVVKTVVGTSLVTLLCIFFGYRGFEYLVGAQYTINPARHGLDFVAFSLLSLYFSSGRRIYQLLFFAVCSVAIYLGTHFGLFLLLSGVLGNVAYSKHTTNPYFETAVAVLLSLLSVASFVVALEHSSQSSPGLHYFLSGFFSFPSQTKAVIILLCFVMFFMFFSAFLSPSGSITANGLILFSATLYLFFLFFHYVWHGLIANLNPSLPIIGLVLMLLSEYVFFERLRNVKLFNLFVSVVLVCLALISVPAFVRSLFSLQSESASYKSYSSIPGYGFNVTYDDSYIVDSIDLITAFSRSNSVTLISKHDFFLLPITHKVSSLGFPCLLDFIVTAREFRLAVDALSSSGSTYIFVDNDIDMAALLARFNSTITLSRPSYFYETQFLLTRALMLRQIFDSVREHYVPVKKGKLLTVYKRVGD